MPSARWMLVSCLVIIGGLPLTSHAQDDFSRYFNAAVQLYKDGENEQALKQLEQAKQRARNLDQDIAIALYEGLSYADLSQWKQARDAFERALLLDLKAKLPTKVSPKVERDFEEVRARVRERRAESPGTSRSDSQSVTSSSPPPALDSAQPKVPTSVVPPSMAKTDRPERQPMKPILSPSPAATSPPGVSILNEGEHKRIPIAPVVLAGVGMTAAGVGAVFGLQSRSGVADARRAQFQDETRTQLERAQSSARIANVLFGTAGLAATGALVTWWVSRGDDAADQAKGER